MQLAVDGGRLLDLAQRLLSIPTENPPGNERLAAEDLAACARIFAIAIAQLLGGDE